MMRGSLLFVCMTLTNKAARKYICMICEELKGEMVWKWRICSPKWGLNCKARFRWLMFWPRTRNAGGDARTRVDYFQQFSRWLSVHVCIRARTYSREKKWAYCIKLLARERRTVRESVCKYARNTYCARGVFVCCRDQISFHFRRAKRMLCSCKRHTRAKVCISSCTETQKHESVVYYASSENKFSSAWLFAAGKCRLRNEVNAPRALMHKTGKGGKKKFANVGAGYSLNRKREDANYARFYVGGSMILIRDEKLCL